MNFIEMHALWDDSQVKRAREVAARISADGIELLRLSFPDQHGILRGKTVVAAEASLVMTRGMNITSATFAKDTSNTMIFPIFKSGGGLGMKQMQAGADVIMVPDPATFCVQPWTPKTGWFLCDVYFPDGRPVPFSTRHLCRQALHDLNAAGYEYNVGLEVELHIFKLLPRERETGIDELVIGNHVAPLTSGYHELSEQGYDQMEPAIDLIRRNVQSLGIPVRSVEIEFGPSQCEFTFSPTIGLRAADLMTQFRAAAKQIAQRNGFHVTFMCLPRMRGAVPSGWHLHQSLNSVSTGANAFMAQSGPDLLSAVGRAFLGGLLSHARAQTVFATPTISGYKRYRANSFAPDRICWGHDNRGAMIRVIGGPRDPSTRLENRIGEPSANPYLYMAAQVLSGLDGIKANIDPGPPIEDPYVSPARPLPRTLREALMALEDDRFFRTAMGDEFIDYYTHIKDSEVNRFENENTEWEQREYFDLF
jgi:glutamine synthetase